MTETELRVSGLRILSEKMGLVEAERFICSILREPFDYTKWSRNLFADLSLEELHERASKADQDRAGID